LLDVLGRAQGDPVSYEALRDAGVEYLASVAFELELVGVQLERSFHASRPRPEPLGVRLAPQRHKEARPRYPPKPRTPVREPRAPSQDGVFAVAASVVDAEASALAADARRVARGARSLAAGAAERVEPALRSLTSGPRRRVLAPAALLAAAVIVAALTIADLAGSGGTRRPAPLRLSHGNASASLASKADRSALVPSPARGAATAPPASATESAQTPAAPQQSSAPPPAGAATQTSASQLQTQGHALLASGHASRAIPVLRSAIAATGQTLDRCLEPSSEECLTYAYALYDLGTALRLTGQNANAVPVLEDRLQIANQRGTVRHELWLARGPRGPRGAGGD
jgi:hypothetical protein